MKIAVSFEANPSSGGGFQQALNIALLMKDSGQADHEIVFVVTEEQEKRELARRGIQAHLLKMGRIQRLITRIRRSMRFNHLLTRLKIDNPLDEQLDRLGVDLVYFTGPSRLALMLERTNYLFTVWDLCHRDWVEFPEVRNHLAFEARELLFREALPKATAVLVDSEFGRKNIVRRYGIDLERIHVLPFSPAAHLNESEKTSETAKDIKGKLNLGEHYLFYPAQFWSHKNHLYVIDGISLLRKHHGVEVHAVFSGSIGGNMPQLQALARKAGVEDLVRFPGFVSDQELHSLYTEALALVMPTYFGPTNLPPLEAFQTGTPVLYSDLPGMREQVGDAAILLDLNDPASMAKAALQLIEQPELSERLAKAGKERLAELSDDDSRRETLRKIFDSFETKQRLWKNSAE